MNPLFDTTIYTISTWIIPLLLAITLHEAAHGYVAHACGDNTAWRLGRVSLNPLRHVDPFGTVLLPAFLLLFHAPFLFGYAKPVPVRFDRLRHPRSDIIWVAAAGPATNLVLATAAAFLTHVVGYLPTGIGTWVLLNLINAINVNVILAVFNMIPIPPLDGGRVAVGVLPKPLSTWLARLEPYGMMILVSVLFFLPMLGQSMGIDTNVFGQIVTGPASVTKMGAVRAPWKYSPGPVLRPIPSN